MILYSCRSNAIQSKVNLTSPDSTTAPVDTSTGNTGANGLNINTNNGSPGTQLNGTPTVSNINLTQGMSKNSKQLVNNKVVNGFLVSNITMLIIFFKE